MKTITGECRYCEQIQTVTAEDILESADLTQEQVEEIIAKNCTCDEATDYQAKLRNLQAVKEYISNVFGVPLAEIMNPAVDQLAEDYIKTITIQINQRTTAYIKKMSDGSISVKRKDTDIEEEII